MTQIQDGSPEQSAAPHHRRRESDHAVTWWMRAGRRAFATPMGLLALLLVAVQSIWRGTAMTGGHYTQADYLLPLEADGATLGWTYLVGLHVEEFSPVGRLVAWLTVAVGGTGWGAVVVVVVVLQAVAALLLWVVLTQVLDQRWVRLPLFAVGLFTPLTLSSTLSWGLASMYLPAAVFLLLGLSALLSHLQDDWDPGPLLAGVSFSMLLLTSDRVLLMPVVAFALVAAMLPLGSAGVVRRVSVTATRHLALWLGLVVVLVARVLVATSQGSSFAFPANGEEAVDVLQEYARMGLTGLVGGPWVGEADNAALKPDSTWPMGLGIILCVLCVVPLVRAARNPSVRLALLGLATYFVLGAGVLLMTHQGFQALGMIPRFLADVVVVVVVLVAVALRGALVPEQGRAIVRRLPGVAALVVLVAFVASATVTTRALVPPLQNEDDRAFFAEMGRWLDLDPRIVLLDSWAPENIMHPWYGDAARLSNLTRLMPQRPPFNVPSEHLRTADSKGTLHTVGILGVDSDPGTTEGCGHMVTAERSTITFPEPTPEGAGVVEIGYFTNADTYVLVDLPDESIRVPVQSGLRKVQAPVTGGFSEMTVRLEAIGGPVCIGKVRVGHAMPASSTADE